VFHLWKLVDIAMTKSHLYTVKLVLKGHPQVAVTCLYFGQSKFRPWKFLY